MDNEKMIENIRILCKNHNITPTKLEEELGYSQGLISRWKDKTPSIDKIIDIADYFHVSLDEVVGYNQDINNDFIRALVEGTKNNSVTWHSKVTNPIENLKVYELVGDGVGYRYSSLEYNDPTFYTQYNEGFIQIYCVYKNNNIANPVELYLSVQPEIDSKLITLQNKNDELVFLYLKVLKSLGQEAPDEVKAEALINSFINASKKPEPPKKKKNVTLVPNVNITSPKQYRKPPKPKSMPLVDATKTNSQDGNGQ